MIRKRFSPELYEQNDKLAKEKAITLLDKRVYKVVENPNKRGVDLLVYKKGEHVFNIECEIKKVWSGKEFKFDNVQFPERKNKFAILEKPTLFIMFNKDQSSFLVVNSKDLVASPKVEVPNKYIYKGEYFYQVPLNKVYFNNIKSSLNNLEEMNG